jgi:polynucleotide 5'-hydroxyl-kinase GRC3/NOL9
MAIVNFNQRLVILGSYGVRVVAGEVTLYGAHVRPSDGIIWVHAPHCHAVPVLRSGEQTVVQLHPHPHSDSLRRLERLSPLFRKLWNDQREGRPQTYQLVSRP